MHGELLGRMVVEVTTEPVGITGSVKFDGNYADLTSGLFFATIIEPDLEKMLRAIIELLDSEKGQKMADQIRKRLKKGDG